MVETLNITVRGERNPELFQFLWRHKTEFGTYVEALSQLVKENEDLKKQVVKQNDWTGMRLALRATEKNSHLTIELLNNYFLNREIEPVASHDHKSRNLLKFERDWREYLQELQAERSTHSSKSLLNFERKAPLVMPPFDFEETD